MNKTKFPKMDQMGLEFSSMPQAVNRFIAAGKKQLVITGTHGKTTTSSILAWILYHANLDPVFMIGGIVKNFNSFHLTMQISPASIIPRALTRFLLPKGFHPKNWWLTSNTAARMRTTFRIPIPSSTSSYQKPYPVI
jgi:hypothetical protein